MAPEVGDLQREIRAIASERDALILAHNYQRPEVQDVADFVGDSLGLSREAAKTEKPLLVFCGVHFMAETAAILSPQKRVLLPDLAAGCSLAATISGAEVRDWKERFPGYATVGYVNTTAEVKAELDYCCTSGNVLKVIDAVPAERGILFLPDFFLGMHAKRMRPERRIEVWMGECHVHAGIRPDDITEMRAEHPDAEFLIHPECGCSTQAMEYVASGDIDPEGVQMLSTGGMLDYIEEHPTGEYIVATENGMLHPLQKAAPQAKLIEANRMAFCKYMKMITLPKVRDSLRDMKHEVKVPPEIAARAKLPIERMVAIG
jgi:quinolinate synthase